MMCVVANHVVVIMRKAWRVWTIDVKRSVKKVS